MQIQNVKLKNLKIELIFFAVNHGRRKAAQPYILTYVRRYATIKKNLATSLKFCILVIFL